MVMVMVMVMAVIIGHNLNPHCAALLIDCTNNIL